MARASTRRSDPRAEARAAVLHALAAAEEKKAGDISVLELDKASSSFTDYFVICSGSNPRQIQAICDEVEERLRKTGLRPAHVEGYNQAEWVLLDYVDFVVHVFSKAARKYYDLERLWKSAKRLEPSELKSPAPAARKRTPASPKTASRRATPRTRRHKS